MFFFLLLFFGQHLYRLLCMNRQDTSFHVIFGKVFLWHDQI